MSKDVWKEYEANPLTHSAAHYLMAIRNLLEDKGYARVTDIARELNITRGSCSISLKPLKRRGLVVEDENKFLQLSDQGKLLAELVECNDEVIETFLRDVLGVEPEQAEIDACKIEHLLSIDTSIKLAGFLKFIGSSNRVVNDFMREFRKTELTCNHNVEECTICRTTCLVESSRQKSRKQSAAKA